MTQLEVRTCQKCSETFHKNYGRFCDACEKINNGLIGLLSLKYVDIFNASEIELKKSKNISNRHYNSFPTNWKEITVEEFTKSRFFNFMPDFIEQKSMLSKEETGKEYRSSSGSYLMATLYYFDNATVGVAMSKDKNTIRYFSFGCDHVYGAAPGKKMFLHQHQHHYYCTKCGYETIVDSSG